MTWSKEHVDRFSRLIERYMILEKYFPVENMNNRQFKAFLGEISRHPNVLKTLEKYKKDGGRE